MDLPSISKASLKGKRVLVRAGFDVPIEDGKVIDTYRIEKIVPTMKYVLDHGASLILLAHQGRPKGNVVPEMSQIPLVPVLEKLLNTSVQFAQEVSSPTTKKMADALKPGDVLLLENVRFDPREKVIKDPSLGRELAAMADVYVNDAFSNSHRDQTSMIEVPKHIPSFAGIQLEQEVKYLSGVLSDPRRPVVLIISGAKMETKVPVIRFFLDKGDDILLGGCIANTFIAARGFDVGQSKYEPQFVDTAQEIMLESEKENNAQVHVPRDGVVATAPSEDALKLDLPLEDIEGDMSIFDIGKITIKRFSDCIERAGTIIWNGPLGLYEFNRFSHASKRIAEAISKATKEHGALSIMGGGDTIDFHKRYGYSLDDYTFVSTGGGSMLDLLTGKRLPALEALKKKKTVTA